MRIDFGQRSIAREMQCESRRPCMEHATTSSGLQQRLHDLEAKVRNWRQLRFRIVDSVHVLPPRRSTSIEPRRAPAVSPPSPSLRLRTPNLIGSLTSPIPRKAMDPRRALNIDRTWQAAQFEDNVNRRRLEEIRSQSGHLDFGKGVQRVQFEELKLVGEIGHGTCGHVSRMQYGDRVMAVKQMARTQDQEELKRIIMDLDVVLKAHNCEHIVRCYGFFITESTVYVCMELMATCLDRLLKKTNHEPVPEPVIGKMAVSIVNALNYLKEQLEIIHRDVKPSNILLDWRGNIKLCDFGIAGKLVESRAHTRNAGCPPYMAPERFQQERSGDYDVRSDVWSVGITLVELARGHYPYSYCKSEFEVLTQIIENPPPTLKRNENFSLPFVDFVEKCLQKDPELRPKYRELMRHEFFVNSMSSNTDVAQWFREKMQVII